MCDKKIIENVEEITDIEETDIKNFDISKKDVIFCGLMLLSSILLSAFGIFGGFRGGFTVSSVILNLVTTAYLLQKRSRVRIFPLICFILSLCVSAVFLTTSNGEVRFWGFAVYFCLTATWFTSLVRSEEDKGDLGFYKYVFSPVTYECIANIPNTCVAFYSKNKEGNKTLGKIFIGILLSLPLLFVVIPLLMTSDEAFSGMVSIVFSQTFTIILRTVVGLFIGLFIVSYAVSLKKNDAPAIDGPKFSGIEATVIISFLSVLSVCYLSYLFSQLAYFFDAFNGFLPEGYKFTLSSYARRGFFEMSIIAAINFVVIFLCRWLTNKDNRKAEKAINILCTFIGTFTLLIIATALSKMFMYIYNFGMTRLRITTSVFMIFLAVVFIATLIRLYTTKINVLKTAFLSAAIAIILLGYFNVNQVVADYNYNAYKNGALKNIDVATIAELGDEGVPYLIKLTRDDDYETANYARYKLSLVYEDYFKIYYEDGKPVKLTKIYTEIGEYSLPRKTAYKELKKYLKHDPLVLEYKNNYNDYREFDY